MHSITLLMKQHSFISVNREMKLNLSRLALLRKRLDSVIGKGKKDDSASDYSSSTAAGSDEDDGPVSVPDLLKQEIHEIETDLVNGNTHYPDNITFANFTLFLLFPTLVYELEYPRTPKVRVCVEVCVCNSRFHMFWKKLPARFQRAFLCILPFSVSIN